jgi:pimeloyl-ACP methyl ester carboxylesterase
MVAIDLRGHGASGKPWAPEQYQETKIWADDISATLKAFGLAHPIIVGWSFGGFVAMDYIRHYGNDSLAGVMLVSSPAGLVSSLHPDTPGYPAAAAQQMSTNLPDNIEGERFFVRLMTAKPLPAAVEQEWVIETLRMPVYARLAMRGRPLGNQDLLPTLRLPILMLTGSADRSMAVSEMQTLAAAQPNIQFATINGAGHALAYERAEEFNRLLIAFADRVNVAQRANKQSTVGLNR